MQQKKKKNYPLSLPFIQQAQHWETECLFEVILCFELLHGNRQAFPLQHGEFVLQINEEHDFSHLTSFFVTRTTKCLPKCKTRNAFSYSFFMQFYHTEHVINLLTYDLQHLTGLDFIIPVQSSLYFFRLISPVTQRSHHASYIHIFIFLFFFLPDLHCIQRCNWLF